MPIAIAIKTVQKEKSCDVQARCVLSKVVTNNELVNAFFHLKKIEQQLLSLKPQDENKK